MKIILLLILCVVIIGQVSCKRKIQCRLFQPGSENTTPAPPVIQQAMNSSEFETIMQKLDSLDLRVVKAEFALQNTVHAVASDVENVVQVVEKLAWVATQTESSINFVEHHVKLIEHNLTTLQKDVRDLLSVQQQLPTRSYIENALLKLKFQTKIDEPVTEQKMQDMMDTLIQAETYEYCDELPEENPSGIYVIRPDGDFRDSMKVYCNQTYEDGGWTVIQKRMNGTVNFYRDYHEYVRGFGKMDGGEFWLGLERIHRLTYSAPHQLVVVLEDWDGVSKYAKYDNFEIAGEFERFKVTRIDGYSGDAGDSMNYTMGAAFSTFDQDYDTNEKDNCAIKYHGAWWYKSCHSSNLNGKYLRGNTTEFGAGMNWNTFRGMNYALKSSTIMIRRRKDVIPEAAAREPIVIEKTPEEDQHEKNNEAV